MITVVLKWHKWRFRNWSRQRDGTHRVAAIATESQRASIDSENDVTPMPSTY